MQDRQRLFALISVFALLASPAFAQEGANKSRSTTVTAPGSSHDSGRGPAGREIQLTDLLAQARPQRRAGFSLMPSYSLTPLAAGPNLPVLGGGTLGRLTKWTGFTSSNSFVGDSTIFESKDGLVGIGTDSPTSKLTVNGLIQSTGGFKFPDGTVQTTSASGALFSVVHDATLVGNGTSGSPLGVKIPLILSGAEGTLGLGIITATNTAMLGDGVVGRGGTRGNGISAEGGSGSGNDDGGAGVRALGGEGGSVDGIGGAGVIARGGRGIGNNGGAGVRAEGGDGTQEDGGAGVIARGGRGASDGGGVGVRAEGGESGSSNGGDGAQATGGIGRGAGRTGGDGIHAVRGPGLDGATDGLAGRFDGNVEVSGTLSKGGGSFKIDHPLDSENKYLYHSFVESPDMMNIYNGNITTNENCEAVVTLPEYFEALNRDFRYQLTVLGTFAQAIVAEKVKGNRFVIKTNAPNVEVSWQVTGIRQDAFANRNRIPVEEAKPEVERGHYLHPEAFNQPEERSVNWARDPERMQQLKQRRLEVEQVVQRKPLDR